MEEENKTFEEKVDQVIDNVKDKFEDVKGDAQEKLDDIKEDVQEKIEDLKEDLGEFKENVQEKIADLKEDIQEKKEEYAPKIEEAKAKVEEKLDVDDYTAEYDPEDIKANKIYAVLAYIGILVLIPLFLAGDSKFARFHTNQGFTLFLCSLVCWILGFIKLGLIKFIAGILGFCVLVYAIIGIVNVVKGRAKELPGIGNFTFLK